MGDPTIRLGPGEVAAWPASLTAGRSVRPASTAFATAAAARTLGRCVDGPGRVVVVVDPGDRADVARSVGVACRATGRFVVHASPRQGGVARLQVEVLMALGKHWNRTGERGDAAGAQLVSAWLRAEGARELTVLRAHQIRGAALAWLVSLADSEGLMVRLVTPEPLEVEAEVDVATGPGAGHRDEHPGPCEDLNCPAPAPVPGPARMTEATARRLRRLHDIEAAALATATVTLGRCAPQAVAAARPAVSVDAASVVTADGTRRAVPEHARALLRGWSGRDLLPTAWADDVAATYLTLRLELAARHTGLELIDPALPVAAPVPWHRRCDPGAKLLAWLTSSAGHERQADDRGVGLPWGAAPATEVLAALAEL